MNLRRLVARRAGELDDVADAVPVRIGVIGATSMVARLAVIGAVADSPKAELTMLASRTPDQVRETHGAAVLDDYAAVVESDDVDAVYIPLPNGLHREWVERSAAAGKHVLVEKPMALTRADSEAMAGACAAAGVVLMEAYMSPFHARNVAILDLVRSGRLGALRTGAATFTFPHADPTDHRWDPVMGGGALADVGIYVLTPLFDVSGADLASREMRAVRTERGVDATTTGTLGFANGFTATFVASMELPEQQRLELSGTEATLVVERPFTAGPDDTVVTLTLRSGETERIEVPGNNSYRAMVDHFCAVVRGEAEQRRPVEQSIAFAALLEDAAAQGDA